jgi:uncharacterized protein
MTSKLVKYFLGVIFLLNFTFAYEHIDKPNTYFNDYANVLDASQATQLEQNLAEIGQENKIQLVVVLIKSLGGDSIENYANLLFNDWKIGDKNQNNGVLLLVSMEERKTRFEVGYGAEGFLTDIGTKYIQDDYLVPKFKQGDYFGGISDAINQVKTISDSENPDGYVNDKKSENDLSPLQLFLVIFFIIFFLGVFGFIIYSFIKNHGNGGGGNGWGNGGSYGGWGGGSSSSSGGGFSSGGSSGGGGSSSSW